MYIRIYIGLYIIYKGVCVCVCVPLNYSVNHVESALCLYYYCQDKTENYHLL